MVAAEPANLAFNAALLMGAVLARLAEPRVEPVVRPQRNEPVRLDPIPALEDLGDRRLEVVVADRFGDAAEMIERPDVPIQEHVLGLVQIRPTEPATRSREPHHEQRHLRRDPGQHDLGFTEIDLALRTQRVMLRDSDLNQRERLTFPDRLHIAAHRRLAHIHVVLDDKPLPHPPRGVTLLAWPLLVFLEPTVDDRLELTHLRSRPFQSLPRQRDRRLQRRADVTTMNPELAGKRPERLRLLRRVGATDLLVQLHLRPLHHPHTPPRPATPAADPPKRRKCGQIRPTLPLQVGPDQVSTPASAPTPPRSAATNAPR